MSANGNYFDSSLSSVLGGPASTGAPSAQRKTSQETVRPRLSRSVTMPSSYQYESAMPIEMFQNYYDKAAPYQLAATAPTSPSSSSTSGSILSSSVDDHDHSLICPSLMVDAKPKIRKAGATKKAKSPEDKDASKIARPPNAWILYRSQKLEEFKHSNPSMYVGKPYRCKANRGLRPTQASFSKQIASMWAAEPQSVKEYYHNQASLRSLVHAAENPGYRFIPNKKRLDKVKAKRERSKSGSPLRPSVPLIVSTPSQGSPNVLPTSFYSPASSASPAVVTDQPSPQYQWALAPPAFTSSMPPPPPPSSNTSSLDSPYAQERRPSLKAQWEAIFPNEAPDESLSASSYSTAFPSSYSTSFSSGYNTADSTSPLWGMNLLPSLSISEPSYNDLQMDLPGAFSVPLDTSSSMSAEATPLAGLASPAQFAFAPPSLALPSYSMSPSFEYWSSGPDTAGTMPSTSPSALAPHNPTVDASSSTAHPAQPMSDLPAWWPYRHIKVKPDENEGIPLEDFLKDLSQQNTL